MELLAGLRPISLDALDDRAALLERVDTKYLVSRADLGAPVRELAADHDVLENEGRRIFA